MHAIIIMYLIKRVRGHLLEVYRARGIYFLSIVFYFSYKRYGFMSRFGNISGVLVDSTNPRTYLQDTCLPHAAENLARFILTILYSANPRSRLLSGTIIKRCRGLGSS